MRFDRQNQSRGAVFDLRQVGPCCTYAAKSPAKEPGS